MRNLGYSKPAGAWLAAGRAMVIAIALGAILSVGPAGAPGAPQAAQAVVGDCTPASNWGTLRQDLTGRVLELVNQHRAGRGLAQLQVSTTLTNSAIWKSRHMAFFQYLGHDDPAPPVARGVSDRLLACGYPATSAGWGENIAYGYPSADAVMEGWLNSPGHRSNIENASFRAIGLGAATSSGGTLYWTQQFGTSTGGSTAPAPPPPPPAPTPPPPAPPAPTPPPPAPVPPPASAACSNGLDDDLDGRIDYPADPGCSSGSDNDEWNLGRALLLPPQPPLPPPPAPAPPPAAPAPPSTAACSNGIDDDADGKVDYPADPGCSSGLDTNEFNWFFPGLQF